RESVALSLGAAAREPRDHRGDVARRVRFNHARLLRKEHTLFRVRAPHDPVHVPGWQHWTDIERHQTVMCGVDLEIRYEFHLPGELVLLEAASRRIVEPDAVALPFRSEFPRPAQVRVTIHVEVLDGKPAYEVGIRLEGARQRLQSRPGRSRHLDDTLEP